MLTLTKKTAAAILTLFAVSLLFTLKPILINFWKSYSYNEKYIGFSPSYFIWSTREINAIIALIAFALFSIILYLAYKSFIISHTSKKIKKILIAVVIYLTTAATLGCIHSLLYYCKPELYSINENSARNYSQKVQTELARALDLIHSKSHSTKEFKNKIANQREVILISRKPGQFNRSDYIQLITGSSEINGQILEIEIKRGNSLSTIETHFNDEVFILSGSNNANSKILQDAYRDFFIPIFKSKSEIEIKHLMIMLDYILQNHDEIALSLENEKNQLHQPILPWHRFTQDTVEAALGVSSFNFKPNMFFSRTFLLVHGLIVVLLGCTLAHRITKSAVDDPNLDYPFIAKEIATNLEVTPHYVEKIITDLNLKKNSQYYCKIKIGRRLFHKYSQQAHEKIQQEIHNRNQKKTAL